MARETSYFVQAFNAGRGENLKTDAPIACKTETSALRTAERLSAQVRAVPAVLPAARAERRDPGRDQVELVEDKEC